MSIIFWVKFLHLISELEEDIGLVQSKWNQYQYIHLWYAEETQKLHLKWHLDVFTYYCLVQNMNAFNLQLQMQK